MGWVQVLSYLPSTQSRATAEWNEGTRGPPSPRACSSTRHDVEVRKLEGTGKGVSIGTVKQQMSRKMPKDILPAIHVGVGLARLSAASTLDHHGSEFQEAVPGRSYL